MKILATILLFLWFALGTYIHNAYCDGNSAKSENTTAAPAAASTVDGCQTTLSFKVKGTEFSLVSNENFKFNKSDASVLDYSTDLSDMVKKVSNYLKSNEGIKMQIKGLYEEEEENTSGFGSLGEARANAIKTIFLEHGVAPAQISTIGKPLKTSCFDEEVLQKGALVAFATSK